MTQLAVVEKQRERERESDTWNERPKFKPIWTNVHIYRETFILRMKQLLSRSCSIVQIKLIYLKMKVSF